MSSSAPDNVKVFISYSHDSDQHKDRVLTLSDRLRADGIDCTIDQYETFPPEGWARWCNELCGRTKPRIAMMDELITIHQEHLENCKNDQII